MDHSLVKIIIAVCVIASLTGCAIFGSDVQGLRAIKEAHVQVFDKDPASCYGLTAKALAKWNAVMFQYVKNDYIVAMELESVFKNCINTTEVGIFFTQTAPNKTEVKVTSLNYNLSRFVSRNLFNYIEKDGNLPKEEELKPIAPTSSGSFGFKKNNANPPL